MIIAQRKPLDEIKQMISGYKKVLIVGCGTCVTVCAAGGEKEVAILSKALSMTFKLENKEIKILEATIERQCEWEFIEKLKEKVDEEVEAILSMGCGIGVQAIAERFKTLPVYPALNTSFLGLPKEHGEWVERCSACGDCILHLTASICPVTRCAKSLFNGPCGGSKDGKCEVSIDTDCAWQLIYDRLKSLNKLNMLEDILPVKDWSTSSSAGQRRIIREDLKL
jgi:ferredoxin